MSLPPLFGRCKSIEVRRGFPILLFEANDSEMPGDIYVYHDENASSFAEEHREDVRRPAARRALRPGWPAPDRREHRN